MAQRASGIGRLLARAGRPPVNPWAAASTVDAVEEAARTVEPPEVPADERPAPTALPNAAREVEVPDGVATAATEPEVRQPIEPVTAVEPPSPSPPPLQAVPVEEESPRRSLAAERLSAPDADPARPAHTLLARAEALEAMAPTPSLRPPASIEAPDGPPATAGVALSEPAGQTRGLALDLRPSRARETAGVAATPQPSAPPATAPNAFLRRGPEETGVRSAPVPPPNVVIDEIRIVTPPTPMPLPDPLASLAARRVGASRHRGGARWPA